MQIYKLEISDSVADKVLWFLNNIDDVSIEKIDGHNLFLSEIKESQSNVENGNTTEIVDVDSYIKELENEIN